jgi:hypothetical protein
MEIEPKIGYALVRPKTSLKYLAVIKVNKEKSHAL